MNENQSIAMLNSGNWQGAQTWTGDSLTGGSLGGVQTTGNIQFWPYPYQTYPNYWPVVQYVYATVAPTECAGDVHVFPCLKCGECKCGKARIAKGGKR